MYNEENENNQSKVEKTVIAIGSEVLNAMRALAPSAVRIIFFVITLNAFWAYVKDIPGLHTITDRQAMELCYVYAFSTALATTFHRLVAYVSSGDRVNENK